MVTSDGLPPNKNRGLEVTFKSRRRTVGKGKGREGEVNISIRLSLSQVVELSDLAVPQHVAGGRRPESS